MDPATRRAGGGGQHVDECRHVVVGLLFPFIDGLDGERRRADGGELLGGRAATVAEQRSELLGRGDLHPAPRLHARLVRPQGAELGTGVALDHARRPRICAARIAALRGLSRPTQATGTPGGIWTIERIASSPPAAVRRPGERHADDRQVGMGGDGAGQRGGDAGAGDDHAQAPHAGVLGVLGDDIGLAVGRHHAYLVHDAALGQLVAALTIASMSLLEPMTMPTRGASAAARRARGPTWSRRPLAEPGRLMPAPPPAPRIGAAPTARCRVALAAGELDHVGGSIRGRRARRRCRSPSAVTLSTRPPAVTSRPSRSAVPACVTSTPAATRSRPLIGSPLEERSG